MDRWSQVELFVKVAELGSMSKAADELGLSNASVSRHLGLLEERLGVRLIERNTRRLFLTEAGQVFLQRSAVALADMHEAEAAVRETMVEPTGLLRVTSSLSFAIAHISPVLPEFHRRYPRLRVQVVVANRYPDFIEAGIDVAIRTREHEPDSNITVRRLGETRRIFAASPAYLAAHGTPLVPADLAQHQLLVYSLANDPYSLNLERDGKRLALPIEGLLESNDGQVIRHAALAGHGVLIQPMYIVYNDLVAGRLVPVLDDWDLPLLTINLAFQTRRHLPAKSRAFVDFMVERFQGLDYRRRWPTRLKTPDG